MDVWADLRKFCQKSVLGEFDRHKSKFFENQLHFGKFGGVSENSIENRSSSHFFRNCGEIVGQLSGNCRATDGQLSGQLSGNCRATVGQLSGLSGNCRATVGQLSGTVGQLSGTVGQLSGTVVQLSRAVCVLASPHPAAPTGVLHSKNTFLSILWRFDWNADQIQDLSRFSPKIVQFLRFERKMTEINKIASFGRLFQ